MAATKKPASGGEPEQEVAPQADAAAAAEITGDGSGQALEPIEADGGAVQRTAAGADSGPAVAPEAVVAAPAAAAAAAATPDAGGRAAYVVVSPLEHDGVRTEPGGTVQLTAQQAAPLLGHTVQAAG